MLTLSFLLVSFTVILHISNAEDLQKLCTGQRYGTLVPNPNDCNSFYVCQFIVQLTKCDIGLHFDRKHKVCNWPEFAGCDWVPTEDSSSEEKVPPVKPENPNSGEDKHPVGPGVNPGKPLPGGEQPSTSEEKPSEEKPSEEKPSEERPSEGKPSEENPSEGKPSEGKPTEERPSEGKPSEENPSEGKPSEENPSEGKPSEEKPSEERPSEGKPSEENPSEGKPSEGKPSEERPSEERPSEERPSEGKPSEERPSEGKPSEENPSEGNPSEEKPSEERPSEGKPSEENPSEGKPSEENPSEGKPSEERPSEERPSEGKPSEERPSEGKPSEENPSEGNPSEEKPPEETPSEGKPSEEKPSEERPSEGKPSEENPSEGNPSEEKPSEERPPEGKPSEENPSEGKPSEGKPSEENPSEGKPSEGKPSEEKPSQEIPSEQKPPHIDEEGDFEGNVDHPIASHHWNLIASIVSVESSHTSDSFINNPTVGAHSPETGYPVNAMTGYDPSNIQCIHSGFYFLPHPTNCQKYFICAYRHLHLHSCGNGVIWNHKRDQCDLTGNAKCYGRDAESEDSIELVTPFVDDRTEQTTRKTTRMPTIKTTNLPATTLGQKLPLCPPQRQVYIPHSDNCNKYFICIMGKPVLTSCPSGMHWDAIGEVCGKPSEVRCAHRYK